VLCETLQPTRLLCESYLQILCYVKHYNSPCHVKVICSSCVMWSIVTHPVIQHWLSDIEIFATIIAALIHDYEHTGTTNNFHIMTGWVVMFHIVKVICSSCVMWSIVTHPVIMWKLFVVPVLCKTLQLTLSLCESYL
jgi:hypothetical protein